VSAKILTFIICLDAARREAVGPEAQPAPGSRG